MTATRQPTPLLTVLIPNYNYAEFIAQAIASVADQDHQAIELLISDDGSTDGSVRVIERSLASIDSRIRSQLHVQPRNAGKLAAINAVVDRISGDYMLTLDADDILRPDYVSRCLHELTKARAHNDRIGFVYSDCVLIDRAGNEIDRGRSTAFDAELLKVFSYIPEPAVCVSDAFLEVAPFDTSIRVATKHHKWLRMTARGWQGLHIAEPLFHYRMHANNLSGIGARVTDEINSGQRGARILSGYWSTTTAAEGDDYGRKSKRKSNRNAS
jgi:glycosyltransferase involved in cell wall biosynthesis